MVACSSNDGAGTQEPTENPSSSSAPSRTAKAPSGDTGNWGVPIYPKIDPESEFSVKSDNNQFLNGKPAVLESRFYRTPDKLDSLVAFYKDKMAASGWKETVWAGAGGEGGMYVGQYEKDGGQQTAALALGDDSDGASIQMGWTYVK